MNTKLPPPSPPLNQIPEKYGFLDIIEHWIIEKILDVLKAIVTWLIKNDSCFHISKPSSSPKSSDPIPSCDLNPILRNQYIQSLPIIVGMYKNDSNETDSQDEALRAIAKMFADRSYSTEDCLKNLKILRDEINIYITYVDAIESDKEPENEYIQTA